MKILHVSSTYPPVLGGMEKVVRILATMQASNDMQARVLTSNHGAKKAQPTEPIPVKRLKSFVFLNTAIMPMLLTTLLKEKRQTIVHLHITQAYTPEMVWLAAKIKRFNYIAHIHIDTPPSTRAGILLVPYKKLVLKRVLKAAAYVVVFTDDQKQVMVDRYGLLPAKVQVVPNGVEQQFYTRKPRKMHVKPRLLFVGRLEFQKNIPMLLKSLDGISELFETRLVGNGDQAEEMKALAKELKLKNLTFAGRKSGGELLKEYNNADIFVLTSEREGMPLVLLEAMAMGLPIIATDVTGNRDVVRHGKTGYLVKLGDTKAFQNSLLDIKSHPERYRIFSARAQQISEQYAWEKVCKKLLTLYKKAAS